MRTSFFGLSYLGILDARTRLSVANLIKIDAQLWRTKNDSGNRTCVDAIEQ